MNTKKKHLDYEAIKKAVSVYDLLTKHYDLADSLEALQEGRGYYSGTCPICKTSEGTPFRISTEEIPSIWFCLAECSAGGNVLDLVAKMEKTDIHEAAFLLHEWFNLGQEPSANGEEKPASDGKGYLRELDRELRKFLKEGDDDATLRFVKAKVLESYRNGQKVEKAST